MLHVTNGDVAAERLRETIRLGLVPAGEVVAWRDPLHEGPVPAGLAAPELARVRAEFIAACGWGAAAEVRAGFERRDAALAALAGGGHEELALWFESDLYDQLQVLQILDRLADGAASGVGAALVAVRCDRESGGFVALGGLAPERLAELFAGRAAIGAAELALGRRAWQAFRAPTPAGIEALLEELEAPDGVEGVGDGGDALPDLAPALRRHLEEFPWVGSGLDRTARQVLRDLAAGARPGRELFASHRAAEERPFLGDVVFRSRLGELARGARPLVEIDGASGGAGAGGPVWDERPLRLTPAGHEVLVGSADAVALNGVDRWLGGVRLAGEEAAWRWDPAARRLVRPPAGGPR